MIPDTELIGMAGISDRHGPESAIGMARNRRSACTGITDRHGPEYASSALPIWYMSLSRALSFIWVSFELGWSTP